MSATVKKTVNRETRSSLKVLYKKGRRSFDRRPFKLRAARTQAHADTASALGWPLPPLSAVSTRKSASRWSTIVTRVVTVPGLAKFAVVKRL